ncbi:hypothetical protein Poli38472_005176 [Pythium oligandrum]|uniref:Kinesin-like protein n=1 Tax=Pythium oligandrum TaxID=41045 RepID=A0A8K1CHG3_PYTOL|nr:hypothetical protein Poli38472_005176 [Pythium oligandrum]|eukprot:TMW62558.1 hypothetical protein Poli38472_005176 [Pythium oligandrum]
MLPRRKRDGRQSDVSVLLTVDDKAKQLSDSVFDYPPGLAVPLRAMVKWNIGTYARIRPPRRGHACAKFHLEKLEHAGQSADQITFPPPDEDDERMHLKQRDAVQFQFNNIFDPSVSQDEIFQTVCLDIVNSALDGYNGTILAYGQTGSGKTYTITGGEHYADRGIIPRVLSTIFEEFERRSNMRYSCFVSYLEIYNESVYDLLDRSHTDRPIEEWTKVLLLDDNEGEMHFRNLGVYEAISEEEALNLLFLGNMNRVTSDTPMNQASSRSHSIFSVMIEARPIDSEVIVTSKLHLVDLAGSERVYKREGTQRMRTEGKHINLSLHHLEQVILSLRASKRNSAVSKTYHVPYRNSMLTSVLRGSLGGNCKSVFIATLNPEVEFADESISTCRFMQRCSEVTVDIAINTEIDAEKRLQTLEKSNHELEAANFELKSRVVQLEGELKQAHGQLGKFQKQQTQWQQQHQELQSQLTQLQRQQQQPVDWGKCEELVERLLLTGDLARMPLPPSRLEEDVDDLEDEHQRAARVLYRQVTDAIRSYGVEFAIGCLMVMKENTVFASNTAVELQEMMEKQKETVEWLEKRLQDQKTDAEQLKAQIKVMADAQSQMEREQERRKAQQTAHDASESDSDLDSEVSDAHGYSHPQPRRHNSVSSSSSSSRRQNSGARPPPTSQQPPQTTMSLVFSNSSSTPAPVMPLPATQDQTASAPPAPVAKTGTDLIRRRMELLKNGSLFVKYGRYGKPHVRFVWCSADLEYLHYRQVSAQVAKASIPTRSIQRIVLGQATKVFERAKQESREPFCFSIEYEDTRTLDLEVTDGENVEQKKLKRSEWTGALQFLLKLKGNSATGASGPGTKRPTAT